MNKTQQFSAPAAVVKHFSNMTCVDDQEKSFMGTKAVRIMRWENCYESNWKGVITSESFAHPAKYSRSLIERIFKHCIERGYLKRDDLCGDCFGGIGTGGVTAAYAGLRWIGCELEPRFVAMAKSNFALHADKFVTMGLPQPTILQGDSRKFDEVVGAVAGVVCSPPYSDIAAGAGGLNTKPATKPGQQSGRSSESASQTADQRYGAAEGQISKLKEGSLSAVMTLTRNDCVDNVGHENKSTNGSGVGSDVSIRNESGDDCEEVRRDTKLHPEAVEEGRLPSTHIKGEPSSCVSVRAKEARRSSDEIRRGALVLEGREKPTAISEQSGEGILRAVRDERQFGNPPSRLESLQQRSEESSSLVRRVSPEPSQETILEGEARRQADSKEQRPGRLAAIITSPPYADSVNSEKHGIDWNKTDPKWGSSVTPGRLKSRERHHHDRNYGQTGGQIGALHAAPLDAVERLLTLQSITDGSKKEPENYWSAMAQVYAACFRAIKPNGVICVVVKDYVKNKQRVPLCDDTARLLEHCGFTAIERIHAMLVKETTHNDLFSGTTKTKTERKSFFRRLAEKKGSPEINFEEVIIARKP